MRAETVFRESGRPPRSPQGGLGEPSYKQLMQCLLIISEACPERNRRVKRLNPYPGASTAFSVHLARDRRSPKSSYAIGMWQHISQRNGRRLVVATREGHRTRLIAGTDRNPALWAGFALRIVIFCGIPTPICDEAIFYSMWHECRLISVF